jgi:hypothetical protein
VADQAIHALLGEDNTTHTLLVTGAAACSGSIPCENTYVSEGVKVSFVEFPRW